jgi:hypothetical protein
LLNSSPYVIRVSKSRRVKWVGLVILAYEIKASRTELKRPFWRTDMCGEINLKLVWSERNMTEYSRFVRFGRGPFIGLLWKRYWNFEFIKNWTFVDQLKGFKLINITLLHVLSCWTLSIIYIYLI